LSFPHTFSGIDNFLFNEVFSRGDMKESIRYLNNAKEILKQASIEDVTYTDIKPVQEACGTAYLVIYSKQ